MSGKIPAEQRLQFSQFASGKKGKKKPPPPGGLSALASKIASFERKSQAAKAKLPRARTPEEKEDLQDDYEMYRDDARDLKKVLEACRAGQPGRAWSISDRMDTAARDEIPNSLYNWFTAEDDDDLP